MAKQQKTPNVITLTKYPKTRAAVRSAEKTLWDIGAALKAEIGDPPADGVKDGSRAKLEELSAILVADGYEDYTVQYLSMIRLIVHEFPASVRKESVPWSVYRYAWTREVFEGAWEAAKKKGEKLTVAFVQDYRDQVDRDQKDEGKVKRQRKAQQKDDEFEAAKSNIRSLDDARKAKINERQRAEILDKLPKFKAEPGEKGITLNDAIDSLDACSQLLGAVALFDQCEGKREQIEAFSDNWIARNDATQLQYLTGWLLRERKAWAVMLNRVLMAQQSDTVITLEDGTNEGTKTTVADIIRDLAIDDKRPVMKGKPTLSVVEDV